MMEFIASLGIGYLPLGGLLAMIFGLLWMYWLRQKVRYWYHVLIGQILFAYVIIAAFITGDPSFVVLDEFVAAGLLVLVARKKTWLFASLVLFALLDWLKPIIHHLEKLPGAQGVLGDDLAAVMVTILTLLLIRYLFTYFRER